MVNKIFVAGLPRSGTTLVQNILDAHPLVYGGPEFDRIPNILDLHKKLHNTLNQRRIEVYTSSDEIDTVIRNMITTLTTPLNLNESVTYISEKTPWNILYFEELLELFPDAKFIMVLRNPIATFNSMKNVAKRAKKAGVVPPDFTTNFFIAAAYMEYVYGLMQRLEKKHPDSVITIKYELLISDLEKHSKELCSFIGLPWDESLLNFNNIEHPGEKTMTKNQIWYTSEQYNANPRDVAKKENKSILSFKERVFLKYLFRKNKFVNPDYCFLKEPNIFEKIIAKTLLIGYRNKYRFKKPPKRVLD